MKIAYFTDTYIPEVNGVANTLVKLSGYLEQKGISDKRLSHKIEYAKFGSSAKGKLKLRVNQWLILGFSFFLFGGWLLLITLMRFFIEHPFFYQTNLVICRRNR